MRGFRFRAFNGIQMQLFDLHDLYWRGEETGNYDFPKGAIVMQYTGLRDKNGVEVCEGDLVKETVRNFDMSSGIETRTYPITWGTEFAGFNVGIAPHWSVLNPHDVQRMEVVGNIYENPELLEKA